MPLDEYTVFMLQKPWSAKKQNRLWPVAQPALHFGGVMFDDVIVLIQPWCNFSANGHR